MSSGSPPASTPISRSPPQQTRFQPRALTKNLEMPRRINWSCDPLGTHSEFGGTGGAVFESWSLSS